MKSITKNLYKIELYLVKVIPIAISMLYLVNTVLSYFDILTELPSVLGGVSILPLIFIFISSIVFKFCFHHRLFIYYISICNIVDYIDFYIELSDFYRNLLILGTILFGLFTFIVLLVKIINK